MKPTQRIALWAACIVFCGCNQISGLYDLEFVDLDTETDETTDTGTGTDTGTSTGTDPGTDTDTGTDTGTGTDSDADTDPDCSVSECDESLLCQERECEGAFQWCVDNGGGGWHWSPSLGSSCMQVPGSVNIEGEESAGHTDLFWRWNTPDSTEFFVVRLDGGDWEAQAVPHRSATAQGEGTVVIAVRACNAHDACGQVATFSTEVVFYGSEWPPVWRGVHKPDLTASPLGHAVSVACHNCYNGPSNEVYDTTQSLAKIHTALSREVDIIELDIADASGTLCVTHTDVATCTDRPALEEILQDAILEDSDALLFIEVKETSAEPEAFALALLDLLDAHRSFVRNGRPVFVRAFASNERYLTAVNMRLGDYPFIRHYVRFSLLYTRNALALAQPRSELERVKEVLGFDMVEFDYQNKNLLGLAVLSRSLGLGTGVYTIPGLFGEVFMAALRNEFDQVSAELRADYVRSIIEETNLLAYVNASGCSSDQDNDVLVHSNTDGTLHSITEAVGVLPTETAYGRPELFWNEDDENRSGCFLDFRTSEGILESALPLGSATSQSSQGFLVTAYVSFANLSVNGTMAIVNNSEAGGFAIELQGDGTAVNLRFGVHIDGSYRYHSYNVDATGLTSNPFLDIDKNYLLIGGYDGNGGVYFWVDQERSGSGGTFAGIVTPSSHQALVGAGPQLSVPTGARYYFDGLIQQVSVLDWVDHSFPAPLVN